MAQLVAVLQNDPALLRCQLQRLERVVDLAVRPGKVVGVGYFENGKVLLRKRPVAGELSLAQAFGDVQSELFLAVSHGVAPGGFREEDTEPYRFRNWVFAGTGQILPLGERQQVIAELPAFLQRGLVGPSDAELAFLATLGHVQAESRMLDALDLSVDVAGRALARTLKRLDERAREAGVPLSQTSVVVSNGRMIAAVRRGRPLSYALLEGLSECPLCGIDRATSERDVRVRPHRMLKAVALATQPRQDGVQWIEVPEGHLITVSRSFDVRLTPL